MDFDVNSLVSLGVDPETGLQYTGGQDRFISALQRFYRYSGGNKEKIRDSLGKNDAENLEIVFHALKSNSKMIGALELSGRFESLEKAASGNNMDKVNSEVKETLEEYDKLLNALRPLGEMETLKAKGELTAEEARKTVKELLSALDDFADDKAASLVSSLAGYPFRMTQREKLRQAAEYIKDFLYSDAAEIIEEISHTIE